MARIIKSIRRFFTDEDGPASVEYAVMIALIAVVVVVGAQALGVNVAQVFDNVVVELEKIKGKLNGGGGGGGTGTDPGTDPGGG